jgi:hypothetical protein
MKLKKYGRKCVRPYPVLGNGNDFVKETFSTKIEMRLQGDHYVVGCEFVCENKHISDLIASGEAAYVLDVDCPSIPGSRRKFRSRKSKNEFLISTGEVNNEITLAAFVVADKQLKDYAPKGVHPDFKGMKFLVLAHETIAQDEDQIKMFNLNKGGFDSLIKVRRSDSPGDKVVRFDERDHFWVILPMDDFDNWIGTQKASREVDQHVVAPSFVLPAVIEAIERIKKNPDYVEEEGPRWARSLSNRCYDLGMNIMEGDTIETAQKILNFPIGRVCEHALTSIGNNEEN